VPETEAERSAIREQLERIIKSPLFKNSKRYPNLLRFVVERSLEGHSDPLKERTLGIEVFGREPDYDTNLDPVVRTTAVEIRKRIAQYYHEPGHDSEIRIDFPPGTYLPEFRMPQKPAVEATDIPVPKRPVAMISLLILSVALIAAVISRPWWPAATAIDRFWAPILSSSDPVLLYIGGQGSEAPDQSAVSLRDLHRSEGVAFSDATALANVTAFLASKGRSTRLRLQPFAKMDELREGPAVLFGAFNNRWTLRLTEAMRFSFAHAAATDISSIQDRQNPATVKWAHSMSRPFASIPEDYAIVSRVLDPNTGKVVVIVAGLAKFGTAAAGDFLTNRSYMEQINQQAPRDWDQKNIELVIATSVVGKSSGPPHIVATYFW
jgi:hypothetical protein